MTGRSLLALDIALLILLEVYFVIGEQEPEASPKYEFSLHPSRLTAFYHRAAVMALLKKKAYSVLESLPYTKTVVFNQCTANANTPVKLSKCVARVLHAHDEKVERDVVKYNYVPSEAQWLARLKDTFVDFVRKMPGTARPIVPVNSRKYATNEKLKSAGKPFRRISDKTYRTIDRQVVRPKQVVKKQLNLEKNIQPIPAKERNTAYRPRFIRSKPFTDEKVPSNIRNLRTIEEYLTMVDRCRSYLKDLGDHNSRFLKSMNRSFEFKMQDESPLPPELSKLSILSPTLLPLFPHTSGTSRPKLLSPRLLSFHEEDGALSLPRLFKLISTNRRETMEWLDIVLDVSGAGAALRDVVTRIEPEIKAFHRTVYPAMQRMERMDQLWERLKSSLSSEQWKEAEAWGFTFLEEDQKALIYDEGSTGKSRLFKSGRTEQRLREFIHILSEMDDTDHSRLTKRFKRQEEPHGPNPVPPESPDTEHGDTPHNVILTPWAFENRFGGVVLEGVYLSPHAFATEILSPEILTIHALSPRAFIAAVLSPMALFARVLSPTAFHLDVLSPQLLSAYVLTPEAFLADILSPRVLEARVLSPRAMILQVLTPEIVAPRIGSAERYGVIVLSPNILSPRIFSSESMLVEVLSPHILGGEHEKHEAKNGTSDAHAQHQPHSGGLNLGEAIHIYPELPANEGALGHPAHSAQNFNV